MAWIETTSSVSFFFDYLDQWTKYTQNVTLTLDCLNAADYIGVPALVDHGTTYVAEKISGKEPSEVAEFLNVKEDFPKETIDELTQMLEKIEKPENNGQETAQNENDDRQPEGEETKE